MITAVIKPVLRFFFGFTAGLADLAVCDAEDLVPFFETGLVSACGAVGLVPFFETGLVSACVSVGLVPFFDTGLVSDCGDDGLVPFFETGLVSACGSDLTCGWLAARTLFAWSLTALALEFLPLPLISLILPTFFSHKYH